MNGKRGREISVPAPHRKITVIMNNDMADKLDAMARDVRDHEGPAWSASAIIHALIADSDVAKVAKKLRSIEALRESGK